MDTTKAEDAPGESQLGPLDEERKKFLEDALKSMTVDVMELLHKNVQLLRNTDSLSVDSDISQYMNAIETILDHVDRIDTAIDFHKIGGFLLFPPCLNSVHAAIRAGACDLLAELSQNNPHCQQVVADTGLIGQLLGLLDRDVDQRVQVKALYALSCNIRENSDGYAVFTRAAGLAVVHRALQRPVDKLRTKASFLLLCLCTARPDLRSTLVRMDTVALLVTLVSQERMPSHEHILALLAQLVVDDREAIAQCAQSKYNFENVLLQHLQLVAGKPECLEEVQYCELLLKAISQSKTEAQETTDR